MAPVAADSIDGELAGEFSFLSLENFRDVSVVPRECDVLPQRAESSSGDDESAGISTKKARPQVPSNVVEGPWPSANEYLGTHFSLVRENFLRPLRDAVAAVVRGNPGKGVRHYENVVIKGVWCQKGRIVLLASFNAEGSKVDWAKNTRRMMYGMLLCLSRDKFKASCRFATVAANAPEMLSRGTVLLFVEDESVDESNPMGLLESWKGAWVAVESPVFFLDCRGVMKNLQGMHFERLPLSKCILRFEGGSRAPGYLQENLRNPGFQLVIPGGSKKEAQNVVAVGGDGQLAWPPKETFGLDEAQYEVLKAGLTREVAILQGPPGTGKTFIGVKILSALLSNRHWGKDTPILVICRTNRALDQLLVHSLAFTEKVVRVGSRCTSEELRNYLYWTWISEGKKFLNNDSGAIASTVRELYRQRRGLENTIEEELLKRSIVTAGAGVMSMSSARVAEFPKGFDTTDWLGLKRGSKLPKKLIIEEVLDREKDKLENPILLEARAKPHVAKKWMEAVPGGAKLQESASGGQGITIKQVQSLVDHWYKIDAVDNGSLNPYFDSKEASHGQEDHINKWFETSVTQCEINVRKLKAKLKQLEQEAEVLKKGKNAKANVEANLKRREEQEKKIAVEEQMIGAIRSAMPLLRLPWLPGNLSVGIPNPLQKIPSGKNELLKLPLVDRWLLYRYFLSECLKEKQPTLNSDLAMYDSVGVQLEKNRREQQLTMYRQMDILGMTMTRAAADIDVLEKLGPKIVVCEEAAQVFEAGIMAALPTSCQHLIMIGDHRQLRPQTQVRELAATQKMDISLFERLVINKVPHVTMGTQHRMRPEIADLIRPTYGTLQDGGAVGDYPDVPGVGSNVFFVTHENLEVKEVGRRSYENTWEVDFLLALCEYLIKQGSKAMKINILTLYNRQIDRFAERKGKYPSTEKVEVRTVDGYQGEEKDIILLSLVRSNQINEAGFVAAANRANVALSRAKLGLFMVGNMALLRECSPYWAEAEKKLQEKGQIGPKLPLKITGRGAFSAEKPEDFRKILQ